jgi:hypothetical protein
MGAKRVTTRNLRVERIDDRTIAARADTWWEAWRLFYFE